MLVRRKNSGNLLSPLALLSPDSEMEAREEEQCFPDGVSIRLASGLLESH